MTPVTQSHARREFCENIDEANKLVEDLERQLAQASRTTPRVHEFCENIDSVNEEIFRLDARIANLRGSLSQMPASMLVKPVYKAPPPVQAKGVVTLFKSGTPMDAAIKANASRQPL